jgi:L-ascorbate metabolism protein UlaG (beta-lactamase superfamily)
VPPTATRALPTATLVPSSPTPLPPTPAPTVAQKEITATLTWMGQATFVLKTGSGLTVLIDPMATNIGYAVKPVAGVDAVTISHEHSDHNNAALATGSPVVMHGLAANDWAKIDQKIKGVRIYEVPTYHDATQGSERGKNAVFVFDLDGLRVVHLGDLGHQLSDDQVKAIGAVDVVMIPIGGFFTIDGKGAAQVVGQLKPKIVIPMHYATPDLAPATAARMGNVDPFLAALGSSVQVTRPGTTVTLSSLKLPKELTVMVLSYK